MEWAANDHCRAVYTEDGVEYEALVLSVEPDLEGYRYATVRFVGYGNEETHWLEDLKPSKGEATRRAQTLKAGEEFPTRDEGDSATREVSKPKVDMASLPGTFTDKFKCSRCAKYLRPPIWIMCDSGHNMCNDCKTAALHITAPISLMAVCTATPRFHLISTPKRNFLVEEMAKVCQAVTQATSLQGC